MNKIRNAIGAGLSAAQSLASAIGRDAGLTVVQDSDAHPCIDMDKRIIYTPILPEAGLSADDMDIARAYLSHEIAHDRFTADALTARPGIESRSRSDKMFHGILNGVEDARIDTLMQKNFPGSGASIRRTTTADFERVKSNASDIPTDCDPNDIVPAFVRYAGEGITTADEILESFPTVRKLFDPIADELRDLPDAVRRNDVDAIFDIATRIADKIGQGQGQDGQGQDGEQDEQDEQDEQGQGQGQDGEQDEQDGQGQGQGQDGEQDGQDGQGQGQDGEQDGQDEQGQGQDGEPSGETADESGSPDWKPRDLSEQFADMMKGQETPAGPAGRATTYTTRTADDIYGPGREGSDEYSRLRPDEKRASQILATRLRQSLTAPTHTISGGRRDGDEIDLSNIHEVAYSPAPRIFAQRTEIDGKSVAIYLLLDASSSMGSVGWTGEGADVASRLARAMSDAMRRVGIPLEISSFRTVETNQYPRSVPGVYRTVPVQEDVFQSFDERPGSPSVLRRIGNFTTGGFTPTADGMRTALDRLATRRESRRILILVTDGWPELPANGPESVHISYLRKLVSDAESCGVEFLPISIGGNVNTANIWPGHAGLNVNQISRLQVELMPPLLKMIRRGIGGRSR